MPPPRRPHRATTTACACAIAASAVVLGACGGGDAFDNAATIANPQGSTGGQKLSFAYFQRCVMPVLRAQLPITISGATSINSCAAGGCHDNTTGTGGALRLTQTAPDVDLGHTMLTPEQIRATEMYRNFYSAQGESIVGNPMASRLLAKPLVRGVLHGGGLIFHSADDREAKVLRYWISRPMPSGHDEFSPAAANMFTPADAVVGGCNTE